MVDNRKIEFKNINVFFDSKHILRDINITCLDKSITTIIGPSGSGKTTLLRCINRLNECEEKSRTEGEINIKFGSNWQNIMNVKDIVLIRKKVGMVFQNPNVFPTTIKNNIIMPLRIANKDNKNNYNDKLEYVLKKVHLWNEVKDRLDSKALTLSGGQQQRLCIARTLSLEPEIILLDEPASSLDFKAASLIEDLLLELSNEYTMVVVSHSIKETRKISDELIIINNGRVKMHINKEMIQNDDEFHRIIDEYF